jgi:hypothetical protein
MQHHHRKHQHDYYHKLFFSESGPVLRTTSTIDMQSPDGSSNPLEGIDNQAFHVSNPMMDDDAPVASVRHKRRREPHAPGAVYSESGGNDQTKPDPEEMDLHGTIPVRIIITYFVMFFYYYIFMIVEFDVTLFIYTRGMHNEY